MPWHLLEVSLATVLLQRGTVHGRRAVLELISVDLSDDPCVLGLELWSCIERHMAIIRVSNDLHVGKSGDGNGDAS